MRKVGNEGGWHRRYPRGRVAWRGEWNGTERYGTGRVCRFVCFHTPNLRYVASMAWRRKRRADHQRDRRSQSGGRLHATRGDAGEGEAGDGIR